MNDVYVGLFIIAAYTVFAALWTGWWKGRARVLDRHAGHRRPARPRPREKWVAAYAIGALGLLVLVRQRARTRPGHPRADRDHRPSWATWRSPPRRAAIGFGNLPFLFIMVALTLAGRGPRRAPPDRLDRGGDALRGRRARGARRPRLLRRPGDRPARSDDRDRLADGHAAAPGHRRLLSGSLVVCRPVLAGRALRFGPLAAPPAPDDPIRAARPARHAARRLAPARLRAWAAGRLARALPGHPPDRRLRRVVHPVGADREPPARRRAGRPGHTRPDPARPHRRDVRLPQRPDLGPSGVLAVVGMADRPQARVVLPGGPRRGHVGLDLRRRQPRHLVARDPGAGVRLVAWRSSAGAWP